MNENYKIIHELISDFCVSENLFKLADAHVMIQRILEDNEFPLEEYTQWQKNQKYSSLT